MVYVKMFGNFLLDWMELFNYDVREYEYRFYRIMKLGNNLKINKMVYVIDKEISRVVLNVKKIKWKCF